MTLCVCVSASELIDSDVDIVSMRMTHVCMCVCVCVSCYWSTCVYFMHVTRVCVCVGVVTGRGDPAAVHEAAAVKGAVVRCWQRSSETAQVQAVERPRPLVCIHSILFLLLLPLNVVIAVLSIMLWSWVGRTVHWGGIALSTHLDYYCLSVLDVTSRSNVQMMVVFAVHVYLVIKWTCYGCPQYPVICHPHKEGLLVVVYC